MQKNIFKNNFNNYWRNVDKSILAGFLLLFLLGVFFSFASTSFLAGERLNKDYYFFFSKHFIFAILSIFIMFFISSIKLPIIKNFFIPAFIVLLISLILVPIIGIEVKGSKRWLDFIFFSISTDRIYQTIFYSYYCKNFVK